MPEPVYAAVENDMLADLKRLCRDCFGGGPWIDLFFNTWLGDGTGRVLLEEGKPVSMLFLLPASIVLHSKPRPVYYIYAVGTSPAGRGRGYGGRLLNEAVGRAGRPCLLAPAAASLFSYYEKQGFQKGFRIKELEFSPENMDISCHIRPIGPKEYKKSRDACFLREGYMKWGEKGIAFAAAMNELGGGGAVSVETEGKRGIAMYKKQGGLLEVGETTLYGRYLKQGLGTLADNLGCSRIIVRLPVYSEEEGDIRAFGMYSGMRLPEDSYFNLELE